MKKSTAQSLKKKRSYDKPVLRVYGDAARLTNSDNVNVRTYDGTDAGGGVAAKT
jgi:hypothetical protein